MERIDLVKHISLTFAGLIVFLWTLYLMITPLKFALGLTLFIITFVVGEILLSGNRNTQNTRSHLKSSSFARQILTELAFLAAFISSLVIILLMPVVEGELFFEWATLELPIVARLIAAFCLSFLPGYFIITIVETPGLDKLPKLIISYFLGFFLLSITGFVGAYFSGIVGELAFKLFFSTCVAIIAVYLFSRFLEWKRTRRLEHPEMIVSSSSCSRNKLPILLVALSAIFMGIWLWWMYSRIGFFIGAPGFDSWRMHGYAQTFLDYRAFAWLQDPWWFHLYLASFINVSGVPSVNAYMGLYPLIILPVLAFYVMASSFFKDKRIASIASLSYAIFSGPTWFYALCLRDFSAAIGYDDWVKIIYQAGEKFLIQGWYPAFLISFTQQTLAYAFLWFMVYASWRLDLNRKFNFFLLSLTVALSYLVHGVDPIIFAIYLFAFLLLCLFTKNIEGKRRVRLSALSILVGVVVVGLIDFSLTSQYDYFNSIYGSWVTSRTVVGTRYASRWYFLGSPSFLLLVFSSVVIIALTSGNFVDKKLSQLCQVLNKRFTPASVKKGLAEVMVWFYGMSLIAFVVLFPYVTWTETRFGWIPWYTYLVVGGVPSFLGVIGIAMVLLKWNEVEAKIRNTIVFCALSLGLLFVFGQGVSFVNEKFFYTGFLVRRVLNAYIPPIMSLPMAYALVTLFNHVRVKAPVDVKHFARMGFVSLLISLIIVSSVSTTLISGDLAPRAFFRESLTWEELEALTYLHYSLPLGSETAYLTLDTGKYRIHGLANDKWTPDPNLFLGARVYSPQSFLSAIGQADIEFLYVNHRRDSLYLKGNLFIQQLTKLLPVRFNNSEVTIYSIPPFQYTSPNATLRLVSTEEMSGAIHDAYVLWSLALMMSKYSYETVSNVSDPVNLEGAETIVMPFDPLIEKDVKQLLEWVSNGGHLVLSNTNWYGMFSRLAGLVSKFSLVNCDSVDSTHNNWTTYYKPKRGDILVESAIKIEGDASLRLKYDGSKWESWIYTPPTPWNLSGYEYLGIWVYVNPEWVSGTGGGPRWYVYLADSEGESENCFRYDLSVFDPQTETYSANFVGWKLHLIPIKEYYDSLNWSAITKLRIASGGGLPVNILVDDIFVLEERERSFDWANGVQGAINIDFPIIEVEELSPSADVRVTANYTRDGYTVAPFAIQSNLGSGKVTYLNANSLYQLLLSEGSGFRSPYEVLVKILEMVGVE